MAEKAVGYRKTYKLRTLVPGRKYISVAVPYEVVEREATNLGMTVEEFIEQFVAVAEYNSFEGVHYTFESKSQRPVAEAV